MQFQKELSLQNCDNLSCIIHVDWSGAMDIGVGSEGGAMDIGVGSEGGVDMELVIWLDA